MARYVIALGAAVWPDGKASPTLERRSQCAADLALSEGRIAIFTGGVGRYPPSEARVAADLAVERGLPRERILLEELSKNTEENLENALRLIGATSRDDITIVSDRFHLPRSWLLARSMGLRPALAYPDHRYAASKRAVYLKGWLRESVAVPVCLAKLSFKFILMRVRHAF